MTVIESMLNHPLLERLGWTLLHFLWQGTLAALALAVAMLPLRRCSPVARHAAAGLCLLAMALLPLITFCYLTPRTGPPAPGVSAHGEARHAASPAPLPPPAQRIARLNPMDAFSSFQSYPAARPPQATLPESPRHDNASLKRLRTWLESWLAWLVLGWLGGVTLLSLRLAGGLWRLRMLTRRDARPVAAPWQERLTALARRLGVGRPVRLMESTAAAVPVALGWLKPVILLPASSLTGLAPEALEALLVHELAHIRRHDFAINLFQTIVETLLFYHPAVWWVSRRVSIEREFCCDDLAAEVCGNPVTYARALAAMETLRIALPRPALAASGGSLMERVARLVGGPAPRRPFSSWLAGFMVLSLLAVFGLFTQLTPRAEKAGPQQSGDHAVYKSLAAESQPTSNVTGILVDETGMPVIGLTVQAIGGWKGRNSPRRTARTDAAGRFVFPKLQPQGYWFFSADEPSYAWMWDHESGHEVPTKPEDLPVSITLFRPRTLTGTVVNEAGKPVSGVRVVLVNEILPGSTQPISGHMDTDMQVATTDAAGAFRLSRLRPGQAYLLLEHDNYAVTILKPLEVGAGPVQLTIEKGLTLRGKVNAQGKPLAGVALKVGMSIANRPVVDWKGKTDSQGGFEIPRINTQEPEDYGVAPTVGASVEDPSWISDYFTVYQVDEKTLPYLEIEARPLKKGEKPDRAHIDIGKRNDRPTNSGIKPGQAGAVRVGLKPPAAGMVFIHSTSETGHPVSNSQNISTGGAQFANLPPGRYQVAFLGKGLGDTAYPPRMIELQAGQRLDLTLEPGPGRLGGWVRCGGKPVSDGFLTWYPAGGSPSGIYKGGLKLPADGGFAFQGLAAGRYCLRYEDTAGGMPNTMEVELKGTSATATFELPTSRIEGRLVGAKPNSSRPSPLGAIFTRLRGISPMNGNDGAWTNAGPDGRFTIRYLPPGRYTITGYDCITSATIATNDAVLQAELRPAARTGAIAGMVSGPLPPATDDFSTVYVNAFARDDLGYNLGVWYQETVNKRNGQYRILDLPVGTYGVLLNAYPFKWAPIMWIPEIEVKAGLTRELNIEIPPNRMITFQFPNIYVPDPAAPWVHRWRLRMPPGDWLEHGVFTGSSINGTFALPLGNYAVEADYGEAGRVRQEFTVETGVDVQKILVNRPEEEKTVMDNQ